MGHPLKGSRQDKKYFMAIYYFTRFHFITLMTLSTIVTCCHSFFRFRGQSSLHQSHIRIKIMPDERHTWQVVHGEEALSVDRP
jgi:hypothetical protein